MHLFKNKKIRSKSLVESLSESLDGLPSVSRVEALVKNAIQRAEMEQSRIRSQSQQLSAELSGTNAAMAVETSHGHVLASYKTAQALTSNEAAGGNEVFLKPDCAIGIEDGLTVYELSTLNNVEVKMTELAGWFAGSASEKEEDIVLIIRHALETDLLVKILRSLGAVPFNTRAEAATVVCSILSKPIQLGLKELYNQVNGYISEPERTNAIIEYLLFNNSKEGIALTTGLMFREFLKYESIYQACLTDDFKVLNQFFGHFLLVHSFELVSDAFTTFREILQGQRQLVCDFIDRNYNTFFPKYNHLLQSTEYITQRQSLKLLSDLLLDRQNYKVMIRYIGEKGNLMLIMTLMRVKSPSMRLEAFHAFKIFVANPNKTPEILYILQKNREKLIPFLEKLTTEPEEEVFQDEKKLVIRTLEALPAMQEHEETEENKNNPSA